jgi:membrane protease YdiL (CAAX protease family)
MLLLYGEFICLLRLWGQGVYQRSHPLKYYGLPRTPDDLLDLLTGLSLGLLSLLSLFGLEGKLGWLVWRPAADLPQVILEGLAIALGISFAEELLFRGWLLNELERDYRPQTALWLCSLLFALLHFIKPIIVILQSWPQFFGLLLLGAALVWAKRLRKGRLSLAVGLHAGLAWGIYIVNVANLVTYSGQVPVWITGIDQNPLAGLMGLLFLGCAVFGLRRLTRAQFVIKSSKD